VDVIAVVDMQEALLVGVAKHDLSASIEHHQWVWTELLSTHPVTIAREADI